MPAWAQLWGPLWKNWRQCSMVPLACGGWLVVGWLVGPQTCQNSSLTLSWPWAEGQAWVGLGWAWAQAYNSVWKIQISFFWKSCSTFPLFHTYCVYDVYKRRTNWLEYDDNGLYIKVQQLQWLPNMTSFSIPHWMAWSSSKFWAKSPMMSSWSCACQQYPFPCDVFVKVSVSGSLDTFVLTPFSVSLPSGDTIFLSLFPFSLPFPSKDADCDNFNWSCLWVPGLLIC